MKSRYDFPSFFACSLSWKAFNPSPMNFGYGGPERQVSKPLLRSTNQVPVRSNGAFGRGFSRFAGASAPNCSCGAAFCANAPSVAAANTNTAATDATRTLLFMDPPGTILINQGAGW